MGGLSPAQRQAQINAGYAQNLNNQNQQGQFGTSGPGALGVGGFGGPRPSQPSSNIDTSSRAGQDLLKAYQDSGVVFDQNNNIVYNPADLAASKANAVNIARGLGNQYTDSGSPSSSYLNTLKTAGVDVKSISTTQGELAKLQTQNVQSQKDLQSQKQEYQSRINELVSSYTDVDGSIRRDINPITIDNRNKSIKAYQKGIENIDLQLGNLGKQQSNIIAALAGTQKQKNQAGLNLINNTSPIVSVLDNPLNETRSQKKSNLLLGVQGNATGAIKAQLDYQKAINTRVEDVRSPFNNQQKIGQIKVQSPIQYSPLTGSTITAKQLKSIQSGKSSGPIYKPIEFSDAFISIPGIPTASAQVSGKPVPPRAPSPPKKLTQAEVNNLSDSEYQKYVADINNYNQAYDQYQSDYGVYKSQVNQYNIDLKSANTKERIADVKSIVDDFRKQGYKELNVITATGYKTVPINQVASEAIKAGNSLQSIGPSAINVTSPGIITGRLESFPGSLAIFPEQKQSIGPKTPPLLNASIEIKKATGLDLLPRQAVNIIDAGLELYKPIEQRSDKPLYSLPGLVGPSPKEIGQVATPIYNLGVGLYDVGRQVQASAQGKNIFGEEKAGLLQLPQIKKEYVTPTARSPLDDLIQGKPVDLTSAKEQPYLAGELGLGVITYGVAKIADIGLQTSKGEIGSFKNQRELQKQIDVLQGPKVVTEKAFKGVESTVSPTGKIDITKSNLENIIPKTDLVQSKAKVKRISGRNDIFEIESDNPNANKNIYAQKVGKGNYNIITVEQAAQIKSPGKIGIRGILGTSEQGKFKLKPVGRERYVADTNKELEKAIGTTSVQPIARVKTFSLAELSKNPKDAGRYLYGESSASTIEPAIPIQDILISDVRSFGTTGSKVLGQTPAIDIIKTSRASTAKRIVQRYIGRKPEVFNIYSKPSKVRASGQTIKLGRRVKETYASDLLRVSYENPFMDLTKAGRPSKGKGGKTKYSPVSVDFGKIGASGTGKAAQLVESKKASREFIKTEIPKPREDAFGTINKIFPYAGQGFAQEIQQQSTLEPESIKSKRPYGFETVPTFENLAGLETSPRSKKEGRDIFSRITNIRPDIGSIRINVEIPKQKTPQEQKPRLGIRPITIVTPSSRVSTVPIEKQKLQPIQTQVPQLKIPEILIPEIPEPTRGPPTPERFGGFKFPGFLPYGGGTGGTGRGPKRSVTKFVASEVDPLRAGVLVPDNVTELVGYTPKVFKQIDINLGRSRRRKGASKGINGEPFSGFSDKLLIKKNLGINL